jgi:hypothetical protein
VRICELNLHCLSVAVENTAIPRLKMIGQVYLHEMTSVIHHGNVLADTHAPGALGRQRELEVNSMVGARQEATGLVIITIHVQSSVATA